VPPHRLNPQTDTDEHRLRPPSFHSGSSYSEPPSGEPVFPQERQLLARSISVFIFVHLWLQCIAMAGPHTDPSYRQARTQSRFRTLLKDTRPGLGRQARRPITLFQLPDLGLPSGFGFRSSDFRDRGGPGGLPKGRLAGTRVLSNARVIGARPGIRCSRPPLNKDPARISRPN